MDTNKFDQLLGCLALFFFFLSEQPLHSTDCQSCRVYSQPHQISTANKTVWCEHDFKQLTVQQLTLLQMCFMDLSRVKYIPVNWDLNFEDRLLTLFTDVHLDEEIIQNYVLHLSAVIMLFLTGVEMCKWGKAIEYFSCHFYDLDVMVQLSCPWYTTRCTKSYFLWQWCVTVIEKKNPKVPLLPIIFLPSLWQYLLLF